MSILALEQFEHFINLVSGSNLAVGNEVRSCTQTVKVADPFYLHGFRVVLIDTPRFDNTTVSDMDVLKMVAHFLDTSWVKLRPSFQRTNIASF